jgi:hypothetical protein
VGSTPLLAAADKQRRNDVITRDEVERLVGAYENVNTALERKAPRRGAKILCEEFRFLVHGNGSFWEDVRDLTKTREENLKYQREMLNNIRKLVDIEERVFTELGIDESRSGPILGRVYEGFRMVEAGNYPSVDALKTLKERLDTATSLVCKGSKGFMSQAASWLLSWKGASVLAGAAVAGANVIIAVHGELGVVSHHSVTAGVAIMNRDVGGIIDILTPQ